MTVTRCICSIQVCQPLFESFCIVVIQLRTVKTRHAHTVKRFLRRLRARLHCLLHKTSVA